MSSEKRKREDDTSESNKRAIIGPATHSRTATKISSAPVTYVQPADDPEPDIPEFQAYYAQNAYAAPSIYPGYYPDASMMMNTAPRVAPKPAPLPVIGERKRHFRTAAGDSWEDPTLADWPDDDFRIFCGDLGNEVHDEMLKNAFAKYPSLVRSRVVRDKKTGKSRGFGFVAFGDPQEFVQALREMNGKYIGNRPVKLRKSNWKDRSDLDTMAKVNTKPKNVPKKEKAVPVRF